MEVNGASRQIPLQPDQGIIIRETVTDRFLMLLILLQDLRGMAGDAPGTAISWSRTAALPAKFSPPAHPYYDHYIVCF